MNYVFSYSTLQTLVLGEGSSNAPLQGSMWGTSTLHNTFHYGGGHIPPSSPSLVSAPQHSIGPNINYSSSGEGSQGLPSYIKLVGSTTFSLFSLFGNNAFSSTSILTGGNPSYGQQNPMHGAIPAQGENLGIPSSQGHLNPWQGSFPLLEMSIEGNPFHSQWNPGQGSTPMLVRSTGGEALPKILGM
jgi:hypothetical protein